MEQHGIIRVGMLIGQRKVLAMPVNNNRTETGFTGCGPG
jgi:hypothetical protein